MEIVPIVDEGLGNSSYLVDLADGSALVLDPERDPRPYLAEAERRGLTLRHLVETHLHADFVSGARELAAASGAKVAAPAGSDLTFTHHPLEDHDEIDLGGLTLRALATPGHTPEHLAYVLQDAGRPVALFSGGTLIVGGVARTDLLGDDQTVPLARQAYRSIRERMFALPDDLAVYPTHGAGSFCSAVPGGERTTTIGQERASNPLLAGDVDEDTFVDRLTSIYGSFPPYFLELRDVNRAGPAVYGPAPPALPALAPEQVEAALDAGAELVDVRSIDDFASAHVPGALSISWREQFATWLGWLVDRRRPVVFLADDDVDRVDLVWASLVVGFESIVGELTGGIDAWRESGRPTSTIPLLEASQAGQRRILDIRQSAEYASAHVVDARHVELGALAADPDQVGPEPLLLHCGHGERAMSAASLLRRAGQDDVAVLAGGPRDLRATGHTVVTE